MTDRIDIEAALRVSLAEHARHAPAAGVLAERIIAHVDHLPPAHEHRRGGKWRAWTLPLVAAGSVAAVAAALVGVNAAHHTAAHKPPTAPLPSTAPAPIQPAPTPAPTAAPTTPAGPSTTVGSPDTTGLSHFRVLDMTFAGVDDGWALGTADCLNGPGTCAAMVHTADGLTWHSFPSPPANVAGVRDCADPCVTNIRFANDAIGYAFGPSALFMTTDGGAHWARQAGGADALETLDGNVIRIVPTQTCSPPGCQYRAQTAPIGSSAWKSVDLGPAIPAMTTGVTLARTGRAAFVMVYGHPAGGAQHATSTLYTSTDDGSSWTDRGEPCPQVGGGSAGSEVDGAAMASAPDGSVTVLCTPRGSGNSFIITSMNGGSNFQRADARLGAQGAQLIAAASARVVFVMADVLMQTRDGGQTWHRVQEFGVGPLGATWIGFESATTGRLIGFDVNGPSGTIWTTRDAGLTWSRHTFG